MRRNHHCANSPNVKDLELLAEFRKLPYARRLRVLAEYDRAYDRSRERFNRLKYERALLRDELNDSNTAQGV